MAMYIKDLRGLRFGRLVVVGRARNGYLRSGRGYVRWRCKCDCGAISIVAATHLRSHSTVSCGCRRRANTIRPHLVHGKTGTPEYRAWLAMKNRCLNPNQSRYQDYGGRGIRICARWRGSFANFLSDMGRKPSPQHTLDRKNNDGHYTKRNCRWATAAEQRKNQRKRLRLDQFTDDELNTEIRRRGL